MKEKIRNFKMRGIEFFFVVIGKIMEIIRKNPLAAATAAMAAGIAVLTLIFTAINNFRPSDGVVMVYFQLNAFLIAWYIYITRDKEKERKKLEELPEFEQEEEPSFNITILKNGEGKREKVS